MTGARRRSRPSDRPFASSDDVRHRMQVTKRRDTPAELAVRSALHRLGYRFRVDKSPFSGIRSRADIVFTSRRIAVFIDGCFWHGCPQHATWPKANGPWWRAKIEGNKLRDSRTDETLRKAGWTVVRAWSHEDASRVVQRIVRSLGSATPR